MGVYVYLARKSKPLNIVLGGEKIQAHRFVYLSRLSDYDGGVFRDRPAWLSRTLGRIEGAWGDAVPQYGVLIEDAKEVSFAWIYGNINSITWFDCDELGKRVGCVVRNLKGKLVALTEAEFDAILKRVTGFDINQINKVKGEVAVDLSTDEGCIVANYLKDHIWGAKAVSAVAIDECRSVVI